MGWREDLQPASYNGIRFYVNTGSTTFGRRGTLHEFAFRDVPFAEDTGRKGKVFTFQAYLYGDDYIDDLKKLMKEMEEKSTPGELVHPTLGRFIVKPSPDNSVVHNGRVGGFETLQLTFFEAGENILPEQTNNTVTTVADLNTDTQASVETEYDAIADIKGIPDYGINSALDIVNKYLGELDEGIRIGEKNEDDFDIFIRDLSQYKLTFPQELFENQPYIQSTVDLLNKMSATWGKVQSISKYNAFKRVFDTDTSLSFQPSPHSTPDRLQEERNIEALRDSWKNLSLGHMAVAASTQTYTSTQQVTDRRDELLGFFSQQIEEAGLNEHELQRRTLIDLRSAMIADMNAKGANLPTEITLKTNAAQTAFTIAYERYADALRGEEIAENNDIRHPLFVPGQTELKILNA